MASKSRQSNINRREWDKSGHKQINVHLYTFLERENAHNWKKFKNPSTQIIIFHLTDAPMSQDAKKVICLHKYPKNLGGRRGQRSLDRCLRFQSK